MVNAAVTKCFSNGLLVSGPVSGEERGRDPERGLALAYAPRATLPAISALFALDDSLASVLRTTREPMVGQMRLTWWHEALTRLDTAPPPAEPVLQALALHVVPNGVSGARLAWMIEGWEELLEPELNDDAVARHAARRGGKLFEMAGLLLGATQTDPLTAAGEGWALADLARHLSDRALAARVLARAAAPIARATRVRWSRAARPLGALAHIARLNLAVPLDQPVPAGAPGRVARLLLHRLTGR
ncbi:MAG: squalene/phytoene synthase family protein [Sphingomonas sp.]|jgi:phytoene synthase|uniref:squalene/phytoene synthase family protein n=1 Tax=Sphingomonas sp. TaxID=28214 RepID=UPI0035664CF7